MLGKGEKTNKAMETNKTNNGCKSQNNNKIKNETELLKMFTAGDGVRAYTYVLFQ